MQTQLIMDGFKLQLGARISAATFCANPAAIRGLTQGLAEVSNIDTGNIDVYCAAARRLATRRLSVGVTISYTMKVPSTSLYAALGEKPAAPSASGHSGPAVGSTDSQLWGGLAGSTPAERLTHSKAPLNGDAMQSGSWGSEGTSDEEAATRHEWWYGETHAVLGPIGMNGEMCLLWQAARYYGLGVTLALLYYDELEL